MRRLSLLIPLAMCLGCTTTPPQIYKPERVQPTEALTACDEALCMLPLTFADLSIEDQAAALLKCKQQDALTLKTCAAKHSRLVDWVKADAQ